jgi:plasmid stabilization system protein ParE
VTTYNVIIQPTALNEIEATYLYLRARSPAGATKWFNGVEAAINGLAEHPTRCAVAPESAEFDQEIRQQLYGRRPARVPDPLRHRRT